MDKVIYEAIKKIDRMEMKYFYENGDIVLFKDFIKDTVENKDKYEDCDFIGTAVQDFLIYLFGFGKEEDLTNKIYDKYNSLVDENGLNLIYAINLLELRIDMNELFREGYYGDMRKEEDIHVEGLIGNILYNLANDFKNKGLNGLR